MAFELLATDTDSIQRTMMALARLSVVLALVIIAMFVIRWAMTYEQRNMERRNKYLEWYDRVVSDPEPDREQLLKIAKLRGMASPIFHQAVQEKLKATTTRSILSKRLCRRFSCTR